MKIETIGFPVIHNFPGDVREFTPDLFSYLKKFPVKKMLLEKGYGERMGFSENDYLMIDDRIFFKNETEVYESDLMITLKNPDLEKLEMMKNGSIIFTMIHYETRPNCVDLLNRKNIRSYSMDSVVDDYGNRMFVDYFGTAFNGCEKAFEVMKDIRKDFLNPKRKPLVVTILGAGGVGQSCVKSVEVLSDREFLKENIPGAIPQVLTRSITNNEEILTAELRRTDLLVDATKRPDSSKYIIRNKMLGELPEEAIILDLTADRYDTSAEPPMVRAFEGTVKGSPESMVIYPEDPRYEMVPDFVDTTHRRITVSCDAWPSINPAKSLKLYENMIKDYLNVIFTKDIEDISEESDNIFERGLARSTLKFFFGNRK